jgi:hypothetical protein
VLSGRIASGKSELAEMLRARHNATIVRTHELLLQLDPHLSNDRKALLRAGDRRDKESGGAWVAEALAACIESLTEAARGDLVVLDKVMIPGQLQALGGYCRGYRPLHPLGGLRARHGLTGALSQVIRAACRRLGRGAVRKRRQRQHRWSYRAGIRGARARSGTKRGASGVWGICAGLSSPTLRFRAGQWPKSSLGLGQ